LVGPILQGETAEVIRRATGDKKRSRCVNGLQKNARHAMFRVSMLIRPYEPADEAQVIALWTDCGLVVPHNNPAADIQRKLAVAPELFLVGVLDSRVVASVMAGYEGHRGWINYLAVAPGLQKLGHGRRIMEHAEQLLRDRGCPKINLQIRATNSKVIEFDKRLGFVPDTVLSMGKRLVVDEPR
jgi:ribosomal protein S18 acetylase RimI-like enzyme